jgi:hypothetical protein
MTRREEVAESKDIWNVRQSRYDDTVFTRKNGKLRTVGMYRRPSTSTVSRALAISRKNAPLNRL